MKRSVSSAALAMGLWVAACSGQPESAASITLTVDPVMSRGPASAPVTIVEFSDYQ